jgi:hypothetical protein
VEPKFSQARRSALSFARNDTGGVRVALGVLRPGAKWIIVAVVVFMALSGAGPAEFPAVPQIPASGWPSIIVAEPFARDLVLHVSPARLDREITADPNVVPAIFRNLGSALMTGDAAFRDALTAYVRDVVALRAQQVRSANDLRMLVAMLVVDPYRFANDAAFRARVEPLLPRALDQRTPPALRRACLRGLNETVTLGFDGEEAIGLGWGILPRSSAERRVDFGGTVKMPDDLSPIDTSIFSISSQFFTANEAKSFVSAVRAARPERKIVVLTDAPLRAALSAPNVYPVETFSRPYTPWPRDPFVLAHAGDGIMLVNRPNVQPKREEDATMVRTLVQELPADLDAKWKTRWTVAPVPFHNGHILLTPTNVWISIHTVEIRALQILGLPRVPVETFKTKAGVEAYLVAVRRAAKELETLYGRPVRFVHPIEAEPELMQLLGGGGGFDLDSLVTLLPQADGSLQALVGDLALGAQLARLTPASEWPTMQRAYGFKGDAKTLGKRIADAQSNQKAVALQFFLETIAASLAGRKVVVRRLPLLVVPSTMVENGAGEHFLLTWNNVVLETKGKTRRAEGFASLLPSADTLAKKTFTAAGYELTLFPPLVRSVILNGGYRCASNHLR